MSDEKRTVIVHYHIYKNSGTSFDHVLTESFGDRHQLFDGPFPFFGIDQVQLDRIIRRRPAAVAFSSHQIMLPQPTSLHYRTLAAMFLRHPILRIGSVYRFKRAHADGTPTSAAAQKYDFADWLRHCFKTPGEAGHVSNAQTRHVSAPYMQTPLHQRHNGVLSYDLDTARRNLNSVEMLGRTEYFERDVRRFTRIAEAHGLSLQGPSEVRHNVTEHAEGSTEDRVAALLAELPDDLAQRLVAANAQDMAL
ncbi:MAG: sulfotransferase family 2 domain-containing protein, partial [Paracoccus sp. (in: a-proteobacteria)]|nr:sulfotransferase family 2 domain-containing protein [Paracoccus sp. (in: a-proteobacteria)]